MPHVAFLPFTGLRVGTAEMLAFGMSLPGLRDRGEALTLPACLRHPSPFSRETADLVSRWALAPV